MYSIFMHSYSGLLWTCERFVTMFYYDLMDNAINRNKNIPFILCKRCPPNQGRALRNYIVFPDSDFAQKYEHIRLGYEENESL